MSAELPGDVGRRSAAAGARLAAGSRVAGYRLEERIAASGKAVVFRARDERLDRLVALKILVLAPPADVAFRQRFMRESQAFAVVDDPHLIPVYEAGEDGGLLYIAMRYVPGIDSGALLQREGPLPSARAAAIISAAASGLDALHAAGLVHRDVQPSNILLDLRPGLPDHVYLTGFGLGASEQPSRELTMPQQVWQTAAYAAPELIEGAALDGRADQYSLACTAFELLTGSPPFTGSQALALIWAHMSESPPPLSSRRADLQPAADDVLARALAKAPAQRYATCREFADSLGRAFELASYDPGPGYAPPAGAPPGARADPDVATGAQFYPRPGPPGATVSPDSGEADLPTGPWTGHATEITRSYGSPQPQQPRWEPTGPAAGATGAAGAGRGWRGSSWQRDQAGGGNVGPAGLGETAPSDRFLVAHLPASVALRSDVSLTVRVSVGESGGPGIQSAALPGLVVGAGGARVTVVVQTPHELVPMGELEQVIWVPESGDSEPVRFAFRARGAGLQRVVVTAWAGGTFLCELALEVSVQDGATFVDAPARRAPVGTVRAEPGEVTLQVRFDGQRYTFQLLSGTALFEPVLTETLAAQPGQAVERTIDTLRRMAAGSSGYTAANTRRWMAEAGVGLWKEMVPDLIKDQFWQLRDDIASFSIAAGRDIVPWELLYPLSPGRDFGFLIEQFPVLRRVYGQQSASIALSGARYVLPGGSPGNAPAEIALVKRILAQTVSGAEDIADLDVLMGVIDSGDAGLLHFACHNTFKADAGGSAIAMGGGPFVPALLNRAVTLRTLASRHPLVFINACRSAGAVPEYTQMMGWAQQFMAAGAGAFVGTLWAVRSDSASTFAAAFYSALAAGGSLGEAARAARVDAGRDGTDPTWLAYTIYGDPAARARTS